MHEVRNLADLKRPLVLAVGLLLCASAPAQDLEDVEVVHLLGVAQRMTFEGKQQEANQIFEAILTREPEYHDARIFYARALAWEGEYDEARRQVKAVLKYDPFHPVALDVSIDIETWSNNPWKAAQLAYEGLLVYPNNENFIFKKAYALHKLGHDDQAMEELHRLFAINPAHTEGNQLLESLRDARRRNTAGVGFGLHGMNNRSGPMTNLSLQFGRVTDIGPAMLRINRATRFDLAGWQLEAGIQPRLDARKYLYLNYALARSVLYPAQRITYDIYFKLPPSFEASGGLRLLTFRNQPKTFALTGSGKWYSGQMSFQYRPYIIMSTLGTRFTSAVTLQHNFYDSENFVVLDLAFGYSPDHRDIETSSGLFSMPIYRVASRRASLGWQKTLAGNTTFSLHAFVTRLGEPNEIGQYLRARGATINIRKRF